LEIDQDIKDPKLNYDMSENSQLTKFFSTLLKQFWEQEKIQERELNEILVKFKENILDANHRNIFCDCLNQYRKNGIFQMKESSFSNITKLLLIILDQCFSKYDIAIALRIMILSQTFYTTILSNQTTEQIYLQNGIISHQIWKEKKFWENATMCKILLDEIDDEMKSNNSSETNDSPEEIEMK